MSFNKDGRATVALLGGSMSTLAGPNPLVSQPVTRRAVSKSSSNRSKHRNSTLGIIQGLFGRREKTQSAIFHQTETEWKDSETMESSSLSSSMLNLPYPIQPPPPPYQQRAPMFVTYAVSLSLADQVDCAAEMDDQVALPYYDDCDYRDESLASSPDFTDRQSSLIRRQGIRRKEPSKHRTKSFVRSSFGLDQLFPDLTTNSETKLVRGFSTPSGIEMHWFGNQPEVDVVDHSIKTLVRPAVPSTSPCPLHINMSQYQIFSFIFSF